MHEFAWFGEPKLSLNQRRHALFQKCLVLQWFGDDFRADHIVILMALVVLMDISSDFSDREMDFGAFQKVLILSCKTFNRCNGF